MTNDIDLSGVPEGSIICIYDYSEAFTQRIRRAMQGRTDLSILYLRPSGACASEQKGFVVMSFKDASERYARSLDGKSLLRTPTLQRRCQAAGRSKPGSVYSIDHTVLDAFSLGRKGKNPTQRLHSRGSKR